MTTWVGVLVAKYWAFVAKLVVLALAVLAGPTISSQAGHGTAAPHGSSAPAHGDAHATATPAAGHHGDAHAAPTATPAAAHGDAHAAPAAHGDSHGDDAQTHGDAAHGNPAGHEAAHDPAHAKGGHAAPHGEAHGDGHGEVHHEVGAFGEPLWFGIPSGIWHFINFVVLFGVLAFLVRKALVASVRAKREVTAKGIEEATKLREEMRKKFEDYDQRMRTIDERMNTIVADAKSEAEMEKAKMVADATALGVRIREDAKLIADQEIARAKRELQDEQIARAAELAEGILRTTVTKEDQARLADEFMSRVGEKSGNKEGRA